MIRFLTLLAGTTVAVPLVAAPVPAHLKPKDQPVPFPSAVGTTWVYEVVGGDHTQVIADVKQKDGATLVTTDYHDTFGKKVSELVYSVSDKGVFSVSAGAVTYDSPWCVFKYPYCEGQTWDTNQQAGGTGNRGKRTAGPMECVKVPAGEFVAVRVECEDGIDGPTPWRTTTWYAPGVGRIKTVYRDADGKATGESVLKSFTLGKK